MSKNMDLMLFGGPAMGAVSIALCICFGSANDSCAAGQSCIAAVTACCCQASTSSFNCTHADAVLLP